MPVNQPARLPVPVVLTIISALLFIPFLGKAHLFDWDEINFAECAREMMVLDDYSRVYVDFRPFWEKPPMFFWMQTVAFKLFGVTEFAARFPNAVCGVVTIPVLYYVGRHIMDSRFALYWTLAYMGSVSPNMYFKSGIIDPWFNLFTFLSLYFFILYHWKRNGYEKITLNKKPLFYAAWSGVFMGLAVLTKGQTAMMVFLLVLGVYLVYNRFRIYFHWWHALLFLVISFGVTSTWYAYETLKNGPWFIQEFLKYQYRLFSTHDAGHKGFPGYHFIVILLGCFPASVFALPSFFKTRDAFRHQKDFKTWMILLCLVVLILFTIVKSRIIHYSSLAWFPVTFLAAYSVYQWITTGAGYKKVVGILAAGIGSVLAIAYLVVPFVGMQAQKLIPYTKDKFAAANLEAEVNWTGWDSIPGILLLAALIIALILLAKKKFREAYVCLFGGSALVTFLAVALIVPKVEKYSQGAAMEFFKQRRKEDCYVAVLGYKSYGHLFYTQKTKPENANYFKQEWLLSGPIDKPVYFVTRIDRYKKFSGLPGLNELYRKNGFIFLKREIPATK